jgi:hypothetical protein
MTTMDKRPDPLSLPMSAAALRHLADAELSLRSRLGYVALLLSSLTMTGVVAALWLTEPALPLRTHMGFAVMSAIGLSWVVFALWVLTHRRVLLARHRIVAGRMAVTFSLVFVIGALAVGYATGAAAAFAAAAVGVVMLTAAVVLLVRAHRTFARLAERRRALERELGRDSRT